MLSIKTYDLLIKRCDTLRVGKMRKFPETFHEYAYIALEKLGLDTTCVSLATYNEHTSSHSASKICDL